MPKQVIRAGRWKLALSIFWFAFTFSMVTWWWIFSLQQLDILSQDMAPEKYQSLKRMLIWEGSILLAFIFGGGLSLSFLTLRELQRNQSLRLFFSNFSHDLKTSLNRLRLRAEVLAQSSNSPGLVKLMEEVSRLDLQLENSLWVAKGEDQTLLKEESSLGNLISGLRIEWPDLEIKLSRDTSLLGDHRAFQSIVRNIFQNAWAHGQAQAVDIRTEEVGDRVRILFHDNGQGFHGDPKSLGRSFLTVQGKQGNGLGLYLTKSLLQRMSGKIDFPPVQHGFCVLVEVPKGQAVKT